MHKKKHKEKKPDPFIKKAWRFIWEEESMASWVVNVLIAFILIKYLVYPILGFLLSTSHPIVAVVSGSMEHKSVPVCIDSEDIISNGNVIGKECSGYSTSQFKICDKIVSKSDSYNLDEYWGYCGKWYEEKEISKDDFKGFQFKNGFNKGDIIILIGKKPEEIKIGDVIVFNSDKAYPIIHRVVEKNEIKSHILFETKGDHNEIQGDDDKSISEDRLIGKAVIKIPLLGWLKIIVFDAIKWVIDIFKSIFTG